MANSLKNEILALRDLGLSYKDICEKLNCVMGTVSYHCKGDGKVPINKQKISIELQEKIKIYCETHNNTEASKEFGIDRHTISKYSGRLKKLCVDKILNNRKNVSNRRKKLKLMAIEYCGGSCKKCGYNFCPSALTFHHLNSSEKNYNISRGTVSWNKMKLELDKCILLCNRCHTELHAGFITMPM